jgi:hypothetical protein
MRAPATLILMYFIVPVWLVAGIVDWLCHRSADIEHTTGRKETLIHLLMFVLIGVPMLAAIFLEINAGLIALMVVALVAHEVTAIWDVRYAVSRRRVTAVEQHIHGFLEMLPLLAIICLITLHWGQFLALFGAGHEPARFRIELKSEPLPFVYIVSLCAAILILELLPYAEELLRGLRAHSQNAAPPRR